MNLSNFALRQVITVASLPDQCYAHRLYGSDGIEGALAQLEGVAAPIVKEMRDREVIPGAGMQSREALIAFLGFQLARTTAAQAKAVQFSQLLAAVAFKGSPPPKGAVSRPDDAILMMLASAPLVTEAIADLSFTLVLAPDGESCVTSDDPAIKSNTYCEGIKDAGVTGSKCRGFQVFFPISPRLLLLCFDSAIYKLVRQSSRLVNATPVDVASPNRIRLVDAEENVYFNDPALGAWLQMVATTPREARVLKPRIIRAVEDGSQRSELLHAFWPMPCSTSTFHSLQFVPAARSVHLFDRAHQVGTPYHRPERQGGSDGRLRRWEVRSH